MIVSSQRTVYGNMGDSHFNLQGFWRFVGEKWYCWRSPPHKLTGEHSSVFRSFCMDFFHLIIWAICLRWTDPQRNLMSAPPQTLVSLIYFEYVCQHIDTYVCCIHIISHQYTVSFALYWYTTAIQSNAVRIWFNDITHHVNIYTSELSDTSMLQFLWSLLHLPHDFHVIPTKDGPKASTIIETPPPPATPVGVGILGFPGRSGTLPETNIAPENRPLEKGDSYRKPPFSGAMLVLGSVFFSFRHLLLMMPL